MVGVKTAAGVDVGSSNSGDTVGVKCELLTVGVDVGSGNSGDEVGVGTGFKWKGALEGCTVHNFAQVFSIKHSIFPDKHRSIFTQCQFKK
jgi:hypothetical protein